MKSRSVLAVLAILGSAGSVRAVDISKDDLRKALKKNPDVLMEVLKENKKDLYDIVRQAAQEDQARQQKVREEAEKKDLEASFKNPKVPEINEKTRIRGNAKAKYTLVEYSDFQCPYCSRGFQVVEELRKKYGDDLRFVYKNLPLSFHPQAMPAAQYLEAAALQSAEKAWQFHDKLFQNQDKLNEAYCKQVGKELGLDVEKLEKDSQSQAVKDKIAADMAEGNKFGFQGTPGFLLNGVPVRGAYPIDHFESIIEKLNQQAKP